MKNRTKEEMFQEVIKCTIENHTGCWLWRKGYFSTGYGQQKWNGKNWHTHRLAYTLVNGDIPEGLVVRHLCGNRACCNPMHLATGTLKDNSKDSILHGTSYLNNIDQNGSNNHMAVLTEQQVYEMRNLYLTEKYSLENIAKMFGVERKCAEHTISGKRNSCYTQVPPYDWRDLDRITFMGRLTKKGLREGRKLVELGFGPKQIADELGVSYKIAYNIVNREYVGI